MLCYMVICKAPLTGGYSEFSCHTACQAGENKSLQTTRDADDIPCNITFRSAGGESFQSAGPTTAKARFWDREVRDQGIRRSQRSTERSGREERADGGLDMSSCWELLGLAPKYLCELMLIAHV